MANKMANLTSEMKLIMLCSYTNMVRDVVFGHDRIRGNSLIHEYNGVVIPKTNKEFFVFLMSCMIRLTSGHIISVC